MNLPGDGGPQPKKDPASSPKKGFVGLFAGLELPNLIQMMAMNGFTGRVELRRAGASGEIYMAGGEIVHAALGEVWGTDAFERLLAWSDGEVLLESDLQAPRQTIQVPWHALLIQTMARIEDRQAGMVQVQGFGQEKVSQASELLRIRNTYKSLLGCRGIQNCVIGRHGEVVCPTQPVTKLRDLFKILHEIYTRWGGFPGGAFRGDLSMVSVLLEGRCWLVMPLGEFLTAMEVEKGTDPGEIQRLAHRVWEEGS